MSDMEKQIEVQDDEELLLQSLLGDDSDDSEPGASYNIPEQNPNLSDTATPEVATPESPVTTQSLGDEFISYQTDEPVEDLIQAQAKMAPEEVAETITEPSDSDIEEALHQDEHTQNSADAAVSATNEAPAPQTPPPSLHTRYHQAESETPNNPTTYQQDISNINVTEVGINDISLDSVLNRLNLKLEFSLGAKTISYQDIHQLKTGMILKTNHLVSKPVELIVSGQTIAFGELVDIEGEIGIKLVEICD